MQAADIVVLAGGRPVVVVEAKSRAISSSFLRAVLEQLRWYIAQTGSKWAVLADPSITRVYRGEGVEPVAEIPTATVLRQVGLSADGAGAQTLLLAIDRWLRELRETPSAVDGYGEALAGLVETLRRADEIVHEYAVA